MSICKLPRKSFSIYWGDETRQLLMHDKTSWLISVASREHDRSTVYPLFRAVFQNMHKHTCQPFKVFMLKINFTTILFKSNTKFSRAPNANFRKISVWKTIIIWDLEFLERLLQNFLLASASPRIFKHLKSGIIAHF